MSDRSPMHDGARFIWRGEDCTSYGALGSALCALETPEQALEAGKRFATGEEG